MRRTYLPRDIDKMSLAFASAGVQLSVGRCEVKSVTVLLVDSEQVSCSFNPWGVFSWQARIKSVHDDTQHICEELLHLHLVSNLWILQNKTRETVSQALSWKHAADVDCISLGNRCVYTASRPF